MKLIKYLSTSGVASRRKCFDLIKEGKIFVNNKIINEPSYSIQIDDHVSYQGKRVSPESKVYIMLNKPFGYTCTNSDPHAEKKAIDLIDTKTRIFSIGRLDRDSDGLLLFTNDGEFSNTLSHPSNAILKKYIVHLNGNLSSKEIALIKVGISHDGEKLKAFDVSKLSDKKYLFTLSEGKKREIRRLALSQGKRVTKLTRISIGRLKLGSLEPGMWKHISEDEKKAALTNP